MPLMKPCVERTKTQGQRKKRERGTNKKTKEERAQTKEEMQCGEADGDEELYKA